MANILVVDDDPTVLMVVSEALTPHGHQVETVSDGRVALALAETKPFDLVIADLFMPGMDGFELIRAMHAINPNQKILTISGYGTSGRSKADFLEFAEELGASQSLEKPIRPNDLLEKVALCLG